MPYFKVKVVPSAPTELVTKDSEDSFSVSVQEPAKGGHANRRMLTLLRSHFEPGVSLRLVSGHHSPSKIISVDVRRE